MVSTSSRSAAPLPVEPARPSSGSAGAAVPARYRVLYDGQCEICQAFVSWLRLLDRQRQAECIPIELADLPSLHPDLALDGCLRELHIVSSGGRVYRGWSAVARLARLSPWSWLVGAVGAVPPFRWLGSLGYRFVARNRYSLSKCRGGACRVSRPGEERARASAGAFWSCYTLGMFLRLPLIVLAGLRDLVRQAATFLRTGRRRLDLLEGRLSICFLGGILADLVPLLFGELFTMVLYDGIAVDPGSPRMRRSLARHLRRLPAGAIRAVVATHHHEEHVGNLNWLAQRAGVPLFVPEATAQRLQPAPRLPWVRRTIIGQPPDLSPPFQVLAGRLATAQGELEVIPTPGHCDDHVVLYDRKEKLLLAGDAFMGSYFATPNPDVDSRQWIETLERLLALDIEVLVEGHGHVHTLRADVPDLPGVVVREDPKAALREKLAYLRWLREQIESGFAEGLNVHAVVATCFPWGRNRAWETFSRDELIRCLSLGHFSRTELVRSFVRQEGDVLPTIYQARLLVHPEDGR